MLTEGSFDVAKAYAAGLTNCLASFGATLSMIQAKMLHKLSLHCGVKTVLIAYDRDPAGRKGAQKARVLLESLGLEARCFDWELQLNVGRGIPEQISDLADLSLEQLRWLRGKKLL